MRNLKGFTLIEILIVMLIVSIVGVTAMLTISRNENTRLKTFANQLANTLIFAQERAMLQPVVLGFSFDDKTTQFYEFNKTWIPSSNKTLGRHAIPDGVGIKLLSQDKDSSPSDEIKPKIIISTSGDITPFIILIGKQGSPPRYEVIGKENGKIYSAPVSRLHTD